MYQSPITAHGFNPHSLYRQPVSNLRQINELILNQQNRNQQIGGASPHTYPSIPNQQFASEYGNLGEQNYSSLNNHVNGLSNHLSPTANTNHPSMQQTRPMNMTYGNNQDRLLIRQSSTGAISENRNVLSQETVPLANSRSAGAIYNNIQKERKAHTMAPLARISGPSSNITTNMFASTVAPSDAQTVKSSRVTQTIPNTILNAYPQSNNEMARAVANSHNNQGYGDDEEDDDDDAPIIVKVQYDPDAGGPPSEDIIRQAVDNRLKGQSRSKNVKDPIVLNFLNRPSPHQVPSLPIRPVQPMFNRSTQPIPQLAVRPQHRPAVSLLQQQQSTIQQQQQQQQQRLQLQEKQRQQQQQLQLQEKQRQYQQQQLQEKQRQQQQEQQKQQQQQQQRRQQELVSQPLTQNQRLEQFLQKQLQAAQQRKQEQIQQIRTQFEAEQNEVQQLIQQQLQLERQQQSQQKHRQVFQQQQRQRQQTSQQRNQQVYQPQQYASLPPMGPRPSRTVPSIRTVAMNQPQARFSPNNYMYPSQSFSSAPFLSTKLQQIPTITIQKLPNRNISSAFDSTSVPTGLNAYNSHSYQHIPNIFVPIPFGEHSEKQYASSNSSNTLSVPSNLLQRSHTAPSSTEMFRPSSALDTPELSKENLSSMLGKIPDLRGRQFSIEYLEPADPEGYPIPSPFDNANPTYPEAVVVEQLPKNLIQHVKNSTNKELKAALDVSGQSKKPVQTRTRSKATSSKLVKSSAKVLHHSARPKQRVKQSRSVLSTSSDDTNTASDLSTSDTEVDIKETKTEIGPLSKAQNLN